MNDFKNFKAKLDEKKGLWDNIHAKRKRGEKPNPPGHPDRPTAQDFKDAQKTSKNESVAEKKLTPAEIKKREEIAKAMERDNPGMDMGKKMAIATATAKKVAEQNLDEKVYASDYNVEAEKSKFGGHRPKVTNKKTGRTMYLGATSYKKPEHAKGHASAYLNGYQAMGDKHADRKAREYATQNQKHQYVKESLDITEISLDMLTKKISNSGMATTKKANKMDKTKNDLAAMKARLAGKPALAKEAYEDDEPASPDEASMAMRQLGFIEYAAEEVMDHIKSGKEFPEWMQNKLSKLHGQMESLHSALGDHGEDEEDEEDMKEAVRRKGAPKMTGDSFAMQRAKDAELNKALGRTKTGRKKPVRQMTSTQRSLAQLRNEETQLDEISKKTLGSYVKKASADVANRSADNARDYARGDRPVGINKKAMKNMKRTQYVNKAVDKMTQEGVQSADKKPELDEGISNNMRLISKIKNSGVVKSGSMAKDTKPAPKKEAVNTADKKPEKFIKPDGKIGIRMVPMDKNIVDKDK